MEVLSAGGREKEPREMPFSAPVTFSRQRRSLEGRGWGLNCHSIPGTLYDTRWYHLTAAWKDKASLLERLGLS